ncbi:hypothetical protein ABE10_01895, partial [Bacillus toyonensis]|nr:hypothetical protein [Bacillus toyonensis]
FAAGARHLDERDVLHREPSLVEQLAVRLDPVPDALRVVQPVHSEQDLARVPEPLADLQRPCSDVGPGGELQVGAGVDRDRERAGDDRPPTCLLTGRRSRLFRDGHVRGPHLVSQP